MNYILRSNKVLIAIPVLLIGGTEVQTISLIRTLISGGYHIEICCYYDYDSAMVAQFEKAGAKVLLMKYDRAQGLWHLVKGLLKIFKERKPDIVHVQYVAPGLAPILAARFSGIRTIFATVHIAGSIAYGRKAKFLLRLAARLCTAFFCVSKGVEEFWFGSSQVFDPDKIAITRRHYTIYNGVDTEKITMAVQESDKVTLRKTLGIGKEKVLGIVGRLAHQKGHAVLLDALVSVIQKFPDLILLVIGKGPERKSLKLIADSLKLQSHIIWLGEQDQKEVFKLYGIMDIFVMPSLYEGFGLSAAEAMAAGLPVVATRVDGLTEVIVDGENGFLVEAGNSAALSEAIVHMLSNPELSKQLGENGTKHISAFFCDHIFKNSWLSAYSKLSLN